MMSTQLQHTEQTSRGTAKSTLLCSALVITLVITGCAAPKPTLYQWGSYQDQVYAMYHGETSGGSPEKQIAKLEEDYQKARSTNKAVPPGYHAHLGLLYFQKGDLDTALTQFQTERGLFPESATYMDRLISKLRTPRSTTAAPTAPVATPAASSTPSTKSN